MRLGEAEGNASDSTKSDSDADVEETAEQKKLRLAKAYLDEERRKQAENDVDEELKHNLIAHRSVYNWICINFARNASP